MTSLRIAIETSDAVRNVRTAQDALRSLGAQAVASEREILVSAEDIRQALGTLADAPDTSSLDAMLAKMRALRIEAAEAQKLRDFDASLEAPVVQGFGGALVGLGFTQAELGGTVDALRAARDEANRLGLDLGNIGTVAPRAIGAATASVEQLASETRRTVDAFEELFGLQQRTQDSGQTVEIGPNLVGPTRIDPAGLAIVEQQRRGYEQAGGAAQRYSGTVQQAVASANGALDLHLRSILRLGGAILGIQGARTVVNDLVSFEQGMIDIGQATDLASPELDGLRERIIAISAQVPVGTASLLKFAEAAGRLQIRTPEGIEQFVRDIAQLQTIAPGVGGGPEQIGDSVGRFLRTVGESPAAVQPLSDAMARLDDQFAASAVTIFETADEVAKAGAGFVRSSADALGLGAALAQAGVQGSQGGAAIAQIMVAVRDAVSQGGQELRTLTEITGLTGEQLRTALRADAASLFVTVLEGLARSGGESARALDDLGLAGVRQTRVLGPLIQSTEQLRRGIAQAREAQLAGGDAAADAAEKQGTLGAELTRTRNLAIAATGANQGLASSLAGVVGFANDVAASLIGVAQGGDEASVAAEATAAALQSAAVAGASALIVDKLATGYRALSADLAIATTATDLYTGAAVVSTTVTNGLSAAVIRARAAMIAFATSPAGIALAAAGAVAGLVALSQAMDDTAESAKVASSDLGEIEQRFVSLDRAAQGLEDARDIVFRADLSGDAEAKADGLRRRLRELEGAATAVAGEIRRAGDAQASIPTAKIEALKVDDLLPDIEGAGLLLSASLEKAVRDAFATAKVAAQSENFDVSGQFVAGLSFSGLSEEELNATIQDAIGRVEVEPQDVAVKFPAAFAEQLGAQVDQLFGPEVGARARTAIDSAIAGIEIPGLAPEQGKKLSESIKAAITLVGSGQVDATGLQALDAGLRQAGASADEARQLIAGALDVEPGEVNSDGLRILNVLLEQVNVGAVDARSALAAIERAIKTTELQLKAGEFQEPVQKASDFFLEESRRIKDAIQDAELSIGKLTVTKTVQIDGQTTVSATELTGLEARRAALVEERAVYEETLATRLKARDVTDQEAVALRRLADDLLVAKDETVLFEEEQRRAGVSQELLARRIGLYDQQLRQLGLTAQGETSFAFAAMRRQIDLVREAAEGDIELRVSSGATEGEIAALRQLADAERDAALQAVDLQERLVQNRRSIDDLANAARSFGSNATDALLGLKDPLEALRDFAIDLARQFLEPRLQAMFLEGFGGGSPKAEFQSVQAAQQLGVRDLLPEGAAPAPVPEIALPEQQIPPLDLAPVAAAAQAAAPALEQIPPPATATAGGLEGVGPAAQAAASGAESLSAGEQAAASGADRLAIAAEAAAAALERLAAQKLAGVPDALPALEERLSLPEPQIPIQSQPAPFGIEASAPALDLPDLGAQADEAIQGLDAIDSGASDAARAIAAMPEPVELASSALGTELVPSAVKAGQDLATEVGPAISSGALELGESAAVAAQPIRLLAVSTEEAVAAMRLAVGQVAQGGASAAAAGIGAQLPVKSLELTDLGDKGLTESLGTSTALLAPAAETAAVGMQATATASESATISLTAISPAAELAAAGFTQSQIALIELVTGFNLASQAAVDFALKAGAAAASSAIGGTGAGLASGGVVLDGQLQKFAVGGVPGVGALSGQVIDQPTYALIGEGSNDEAIMPLNSQGGVRGIGPSGEPISLPLDRDGSGKLGVRVPQLGANVARYALGGVPGRPLESFSVPADVQRELERRGAPSQSFDNRDARQFVFNSTVVVQGGSSQLDQGMRYSLRQYQADLRAAAMRQ